MRQTGEGAAPVASSSANAEPIVAHAILDAGNDDGEAGIEGDVQDDGPHDDEDGFHVAGRIKWFDATRGFGFLVSD
ncbi:MAG: hypothetical protein Q8K85_08140, partial [Hyphomicrobium sp.]|nr:hypothetical protein [Hyphomicrobium sp.]